MLCPQELCYRDLDNDDYGTIATVTSSDIDCFDAFEATNSTDCNDGNANIHPGAVEIVADNIDEDCNAQELFVMFLRSVHSRVLFEQMKGRGVRVINPDELKAVTPDVAPKP